MSDNTYCRGYPRKNFHLLAPIFLNHSHYGRRNAKREFLGNLEVPLAFCIAKRREMEPKRIPARSVYAVWLNITPTLLRCVGSVGRSINDSLLGTRYSLGCGTVPILLDSGYLELVDSLLRTKSH
jgi:hypothetical protein